MAERHETQRSIIRNYLLKGKSITQQGAIDLCDCYRLSSIIHRLRHEDMIPILMDQPEASEGKPYARYWIDKEYFSRQLELNF